MPPVGGSRSVSPRSRKSRRQQRYELQEKIGAGGMGTVFRALDRELNRTVAVKILRPELAGDLRNLLRLKRELVLASRVTDEHVVRVHDIGEVNGQPLIAMDWVEGESLAHLLDRVHRLPPSQTYALAVQICQALRSIHAANIVHRDLKPGNLLIRADGVLLVSDFGLARSALPQDFSLTGVGECSGTPLYMAPEQLAGLPADARSDLYALGIVLLEMLTGTTALEALKPLRSGWFASPIDDKQARSEELRKLEALELVIRRCQHLDRTERYPSVDALLQDLQTGSADIQPLSAHNPAAPRQWLPATSRARRWWAAALLPALLLLALLGYQIQRRSAAARMVEAQGAYAKAMDLLSGRDEMVDLQGALERLNRALALNPNLLPAVRARLETLIQLNEASQDRRWLIQAQAALGSPAAARLEPEERKLLQATIDFQSGLPQKVIQALENDSRLLASSNAANLLLGRAIEASGRIEPALAYYRAAARLSPESWRAHNDLGYASLGLGRLEQARREFSRVIELKPGLSTGYASLGTALLDNGDLAGARRAFEAALVRSAAPESYFNLGVAAYYSREYATSIPFFESAIRMRPDSDRYRLALADVLRRLHRGSQARDTYMHVLAALERVAQSGSLSAEQQCRRALCFARLGDRASARAALEGVAITNPYAAYARAVLALVEGRTRTAHNYLAEAIRYGYPRALLDIDPAFDDVP